MGKPIKIAIAGVGNCASALVQGIHFYRQNEDSLGLMHEELGGYKVGDIEVVAAFDIDARKVGKDLAEAIFAKPNCTQVFCNPIPKTGVVVKKGPVLDGVAPHMNDSELPEEERFVVADDDDPVDVVEELRRSGAEILVNYMPVGSEQAARFYAQAALEAGCAFVNCMPCFIASDPEWAKKFEERGLPVVGDDIKSQVGATIVHRTLVRLFTMRGVKVERTYQLNFGGNTDFLNMLERSRLKTKKISKTESVQSQLDVPLERRNIHIGPSDYVPWLDDQKVCFIRIEGRKFGGVPITLDLRLSVEDSPNSAAVVVDAIRAAKIALDRGIGGPLLSASAWCMKHPPKQFPDEQAHRMLMEFVEGKRES